MTSPGQQRVGARVGRAQRDSSAREKSEWASDETGTRGNPTDGDW